MKVEGKAMDEMEQVLGLIDQISEIMKKKYPKCTRVSMMADSDSYINVEVVQWGKGKDKNKHRSFASVTRDKDGKRHTYDVKSYNAYLKEHGELLGGVEE